MKKSFLWRQRAVIACMLCFGVLFPDLYFDETIFRYEPKYEMMDSSDSENGREYCIPRGRQLLEKLLKDEPEEIKMKSRLLELLRQYFKDDR